MKHKKIIAVILCAVTPAVHAATLDTLAETTITATRIEQPLSQSLQHTTVITRKQIQASQLPDIPSLLSRLAGVEVYQSGGIGKQSNVFMRGSNSTHTLVLLDGVRIGSATTGATAIDQLMLDQVERIEVVRGNVSSLYGSEAMGGVVQIFTKRGKGAPALSASAGFGTHNSQRAAAGFAGEVLDTSFSGQISNIRTDGVSAINTTIVPTANPNKNGYDNLSFSGNVRHAFNQDHSVSAALFNSQGSISLDDSNPFALPTDVRDSRATLSKFSLASENRFAEHWQSRLQWSEGRDDLKNYLNGTLDNGLFGWGTYQTKNRQLSWQNTVTVNDHNVLLLGAENLQQRVASSTIYTQNSRRVNSLFAGYTRLFDAHQVQVNVRQDHYSDFGSANTGLIGYGYTLNDAWRLSANLSSAFKAPTFNDMYLPAAWGGNPLLVPERSRNTELGIHYGSGTQQADVVYFNNHITDLIQYRFPLTQNIAQARIEGVEASYAAQYADTHVSAALTVQNPRDSQTGLVLLRRAKTFANLGVTQQLGAWQVGGEWQHSGTRVDIDINTFARTTLAGYDLVNLTANYAMDKSWVMSLRADNLFNKQYMLAHGYNTLGRTLYLGINYRQ